MQFPWIRSLMLLSYASALAAIAVGGYSYHIGLQMFWSAGEHRYDVVCEHGSVIVSQLHEYEFETPLRFGIYTPETKRGLEGFKTTGWWHGENSWWERTGYSVKHRYRFCGFEWAAGIFWPPFVWQHPKVPFSLVQVPVVALVAVFSVLPAFDIFRRVRSIWLNPDGCDEMKTAPGEIAEPSQDHVKLDERTQG